jgi:integral membrane protein
MTLQASGTTVYRILAIVTGIVLAFLTLVAIPYKYVFAGTGTWTAYAWMAHGWLYILYFVAAVELGFRKRWSIGKILLYAIAGTVPFASFWAEYRLRRDFTAGV